MYDDHIQKRILTQEQEAEVRAWLPDYLEQTGRSTRKNFLCLNPEHSETHPSMSYDKKTNRVHCFACGANYSIFDVVGLDYGLIDFTEQVRKAAELYGITPAAEYNPPKKPVKEKAKAVDPAPKQEDKASYKGFFLEAAKHIEETDYHRGISLETLKKYKVGYVPEWKWPLEEYLRIGEEKGENRTPKGWEKIPASPRLIIPTSEYGYLARDTREGLTEEQKGYEKQHTGPKDIFNKKRIPYAEQPIFVVEGELDALSIIDVGGEAIAMGSLAMVHKLLETLKEYRPNKPLIISLDNENKYSVEKAEEELFKGLKELGIDFYNLKISGRYKDANDRLQRDREGLKTDVALYKDVETNAVTMERERLKREAVKYSIKKLFAEIKSDGNRFIPTGYKPLDEKLSGGLRAGLYVIGAVSSLGKTTFCLQMADQIAEAGIKVLYFSLEMSRYELMARSISRLTFLQAKEDAKLFYKDFTEDYINKTAKSTLGILDGTRYKNYGENDKQIIEKATEKYEEIAENIWITEGVGNISVQQIKEKTEKFKEIYGTAPVIFIDYVQILAPFSEKMTDKQNMDRSIVELKRLSRDLKTPVICISSYNRNNYKSPANEAAFKESGSLEYTADVLIGLQYDGMDEVLKETSDAKKEIKLAQIRGENENQANKGSSQRIQVKILKSRNSCRGNYVTNLYPRFNCFGTDEIIENEEQYEQDSGWDYGRTETQAETPEKQTWEQISIDNIDDIFGKPEEEMPF